MTKRFCPICEELLKPTTLASGECQGCGWEGELCMGGKEPSLPVPAPKLSYVSIDIETTGLDEEKCQTLEIGAIFDDWKRPIAELPVFRRVVAWNEVSGSPFAMALNAGLLKMIGTMANDKPTDPGEALEMFFERTGMDILPVNPLTDRILSILWGPVAWYEIPNQLLLSSLDDPEIMALAANPPGQCCACKPEELAGLFACWLKKLGIDTSKGIQAAGKNFASFDLQFLKRLPHFKETISFRHRIIDPAILFWTSTDEKLPDSKLCYERAGYDTKVAHTAVEDARAVVWLVRQGVKRISRQSP